jgi:hypothetical protein
MGIRFPVLIVEAKGLSLNGGLVSAQNQAAVRGACMLAILQDPHNQAHEYADPAASAEVAQDNTQALCFSITIEGAINEMNVHFMHEGLIHMHCNRVYRTTFERDTMEFVYVLSQLLEWGKREYRTGIMKERNRVPRPGTAS